MPSPGLTRLPLQAIVNRGESSNAAPTATKVCCVRSFSTVAYTNADKHRRHSTHKSTVFDVRDAPGSHPTRSPLEMSSKYMHMGA